jgi:hypothetical protein
MIVVGVAAYTDERWTSYTQVTGGFLTGRLDNWFEPVENLWLHDTSSLFTERRGVTPSKSSRVKR